MGRGREGRDGADSVACLPAQHAHRCVCRPRQWAARSAVLSDHRTPRVCACDGGACESVRVILTVRQRQTRDSLLGQPLLGQVWNSLYLIQAKLEETDLLDGPRLSGETALLIANGGGGDGHSPPLARARRRSMSHTCFALSTRRCRRQGAAVAAVYGPCCQAPARRLRTEPCTRAPRRAVVVG